VTANRIAALCFAVLVAATIAVLAISQRVRSNLVVDQVDLRNEFDPSAGQQALIRFRLTQDEDRATVEVIDERGHVVETLLDGRPLGDYEIHRFRWDGEGAEAGSYEVLLTLDSLDRGIVLPEEIDLRRDGDG
jgi:hypothetical protein